MRSLALATALALTVGCTADDGVFQHQATLYSASRGVAIQDDVNAQAGMMGNTCQVGVASGTVGDDQDVALDDDSVEDTLDGVVLVLGTDGLHLYSPGDWQLDGQAAIPGTNIVDGGLYEGGLVAVRSADQGVTVEWTSDMSDAVFVDGALLDMDVERATGTVFTATDAGVMVVTADGATLMDAGSMVAWDGLSEVLYVADADGAELRAVEPDGTLRFATAIAGSVKSVASLGGRAVVSVERVDHSGELVLIDGFTGVRLSSQSTPAGAPQMEASPSGDTLAIVLPNQVHFFRAVR